MYFAHSKRGIGQADAARRLVERAGAMLTEAFRINPARGQATTLRTWALPGFGPPGAEPTWAEVLDHAITLEKAS